MKRFKILIIAVIIIITAIAYYQLDKQLFYYGRNNLHIYHLLPYNVEPDYQPPFEGGFALRQEDGFSIAGKGVSYTVNNKKIWINEVLKYGFHKKNLIAFVTDSNRTEYYVKFNQGHSSSSEINGTIMFDNKEANSNQYQWIKIVGNDGYILNLALWRNCLMFIAISLFLVLIYVLVKHRRKTS